MRLALKVDVRYFGGTLLSHVNNGTVTDDPAQRFYYNGVRDGQRRALEVIEYCIRAALMRSGTPEDQRAGLEQALQFVADIRADRSLRFLERL